MSGILQFTLTHHLHTIMKNCKAPLIKRLIPFSAIATVNVLNLGITHKNEFSTGIKAFDSHGND